MARRILLFLAVNILVVATLSVILSIFHIQPFLTGYGLDLRSLLIFCLVWGMGGALISLALSKQMAKWIMRVRIVDPKTPDPQLRHLIALIDRLAKEASLPNSPEFGIFESPEPNAFATGPSKSRSLIAVSTGLLRQMSEGEIEGVLAHEMTHIANGDMVTMTLVQGVINAFVMFLARILAYFFSGFGKSRDGGNTGSYLTYALFVFLFEMVFMILGSMVVCWFSRWREFRADRGGARLSSKEKMIAALKTLQHLQKISDPRADKASFQALKISTRKLEGWKRLFATHPPLEERIERLSQK